MGTLRNLGLLTVALLALGACAKSNTMGGSSETHFLALCDDSSCGEGLSCVCGVCTVICGDNDRCDELNGAASCRTPTPSSSCDADSVCDVECDEDADCSALGDQHTCEAHRCRAPMLATGSAGESGSSGASSLDGGGAGAGGVGGSSPPAACTSAYPINELLQGASYEDCSPEVVGQSPTDVASCVNAAQEAERPFVVHWPVQGIDSALEDGFVGVADEADYTVYTLHYDSAGFVSDAYPDDVWIAAWSPCDGFGAAVTCDALEDCFDCAQSGQLPECGCSMDGDEPITECHVATGSTSPMDTDACAANGCRIDGVCYPDGQTTEDGCCTCEAGQGSCIEPGWCPSWPLIGKRCTVDDECKEIAESGLQCHAAIGSDKNICTRSCNFGCPTGTECAHVEAFSGQLCLRTCESNADCNIEAFGAPLGSECVAGYCQ
jgi:hypothetical protein